MGRGISQCSPGRISARSSHGTQSPAEESTRDRAQFGRLGPDRCQTQSGGRPDQSPSDDRKPTCGNAGGYQRPMCALHDAGGNCCAKDHTSAQAVLKRKEPPFWGIRIRPIERARRRRCGRLSQQWACEQSTRCSAPGRYCIQSNCSRGSVGVGSPIDAVPIFVARRIRTATPVTTIWCFTVGQLHGVADSWPALSEEVFDSAGWFDCGHGAFMLLGMRWRRRSWLCARMALLQRMTALPSAPSL